MDFSIFEVVIVTHAVDAVVLFFELTFIFVAPALGVVIGVKTFRGLIRTPYRDF